MHIVGKVASNYIDAVLDAKIVVSVRGFAKL